MHFVGAPVPPAHPAWSLLTHLCQFVSVAVPRGRSMLHGMDQGTSKGTEKRLAVAARKAWNLTDEPHV